MLTYSVHQSIASSQQAKESADSVRGKIAELKLKSDWIKLDHIETTFTGVLSVTGTDEDDRKAQARKQICEKIKPILKEEPEKYRPTVNVALMLEYNGRFIEFEV
ncbi:hypothetical protein [Pseudomonas cichorii]|uniref:hypothetical protein n=1 Tax=Pseudomonas cichorii TaxID=36746 RepID=UPI001C8A97A1|nr:hypothetical protein [Pseudomonas cichorii]